MQLRSVFLLVHGMNVHSDASMTRCTTGNMQMRFAANGTMSFEKFLHTSQCLRSCESEYKGVENLLGLQIIYEAIMGCASQNPRYVHVTSMATCIMAIRPTPPSLFIQT